MRLFWLFFTAFLSIHTIAIDITGIWSGTEYFDNGHAPIPWRVELKSPSPGEAWGSNVGQRSKNPRYRSLFVEMKGTVVENTVTFTKEYNGERGIYFANNFVKGTLSADGKTISGTWVIKDELGRRTGKFSWKKVENLAEADELKSREIESELPEGENDTAVITELIFNKKQSVQTPVDSKAAEPIRAPSSEVKKPTRLSPQPQTLNVYQSSIEESGEFWK